MGETNALRMLDTLNITYIPYEYDVTSGYMSGRYVSQTR